MHGGSTEPSLAEIYQEISELLVDKLLGFTQASTSLHKKVCDEMKQTRKNEMHIKCYSW